MFPRVLLFSRTRSDHMDFGTRQRITLQEDSAPYLPSHVRLMFDKTRQQWAVLAPEKVMWPDDISVEILRKCDGTATTRQIASDLAEEYQAPEAEVYADVLEFLQEWSDRLLVRSVMAAD
ncbi:bifunctional coenzyme PQQ synthesis protein C/D [Roseibium sp. TrichSKD4]|nr:bifunctional coenzyme PQQ synthesis protein C/D [Roseibium sp. TrichSKD4]